MIDVINLIPMEEDNLLLNLNHKMWSFKLYSLWYLDHMRWECFKNFQSLIVSPLLAYIIQSLLYYDKIFNSKRFNYLHHSEKRYPSSTSYFQMSTLTISKSLIFIIKVGFI